MNETQKIFDQISNAIPNIKPGTMRFWGEWFGKPYDNQHKLVKCEVNPRFTEIGF
jgi:hypothetical protein